MSDARVLRQWIASNSVGIESLRDEWKLEPSLSFAAAGPLWRKPVVQVEPDLLLAPMPSLVENVMGDGTYFTLMDGYREAAGSSQLDPKEAVERFTRFYGEFFEDHVAGILECAYEGRTNVRFSREVEYDRVKSSDVIVAEGDNIIFVEIVAKRMNLRESVLRLNPVAIAKDIQAAILDKAAQLDRNIRDFRSGKLLPDFPRSEGQHFFPVIVAPRDLPRINAITTWLQDAGQKKGLLADAEPLELLDLGEIEQLERSLHEGLSLSALLDRKNGSTPHNRMMSLHNYLIHVEPGTLVRGPSPTRERGSAIARQILTLAESWMAQS